MKIVGKLAVMAALVCSQPLLRAAEPAYKAETWDAAPLLTWDTAGGRWLENGKPTGNRPNRNTDVVLPDADKPYLVVLAAARHLTIGRNAFVRGGSHARPMTIWGNLWIKEGGQLHFCNIRGPKHTYFRIDGAKYPEPGGKRAFHFTPNWGKHGAGTNEKNMAKLSRSDITHKFQVCKYKGGSVEFIGTIGVGDEVQVQYGKMIIGPDSEFRFAGCRTKACFEVFDGGILELQSGATLAPFYNENSMNIFNVNVYKGGTLQAGSPERPITRDATVKLGFSDAPADSGRSGLYAAAGSTVRVFSADPNRARLVFTSITSSKDFYGGKGEQIGDPGRKAKGGAGIVMHFGGATEFNGVRFDFVREGGIRLRDLPQRSSWKNVSFGANCASADANRLVTRMTRNPDTYYHRRKYMRYYLVERAIQSMEKETGEKADVLRKVPRSKE